MLCLLNVVRYAHFLQILRVVLLLRIHGLLQSLEVPRLFGEAVGGRTSLFGVEGVEHGLRKGLVSGLLLPAIEGWEKTTGLARALPEVTYINCFIYSRAPVSPIVLQGDPPVLARLEVRFGSKVRDAAGLLSPQVAGHRPLLINFIVGIPLGNHSRLVLVEVRRRLFNRINRLWIFRLLISELNFGFDLAELLGLDELGVVPWLLLNYVHIVNGCWFWSLLILFLVLKGS